MLVMTTGKRGPRNCHTVHMLSDLESEATWVVIGVKAMDILVYLAVFGECPNKLNFKLHNLKVKMAIEKDLLRLQEWSSSSQ